MEPECLFLARGSHITGLWGVVSSFQGLREAIKNSDATAVKELLSKVYKMTVRMLML